MNVCYNTDHHYHGLFTPLSSITSACYATWRTNHLTQLEGRHLKYVFISHEKFKTKLQVLKYYLFFTVEYLITKQEMAFMLSDIVLTSNVLKLLFIACSISLSKLG